MKNRKDWSILNLHLEEDKKEDRVMDFVKVPVEFFQIKELNNTELIVLGIYKYFTEEGKKKKCTMSNQQIADLLNMNRRNVIYIKNHLNELGFIKTKGKDVVYLGINNTPKGEVEFTSKGEVEFTTGVKHTSLEGEVEFTTGVKHTSLEGETHFTSKGETHFTAEVNHSSLINVKKIKKNKEEERIGIPSNFSVAVAALPKEYKKQEMIDYVKETMSDWVDCINSSDECDITQVTTTLKKVIFDKFNSVMYSNVPVIKTEVKKTTMDMF